MKEIYHFKRSCAKAEPNASVGGSRPCCQLCAPQSGLMNVLLKQGIDSIEKLIAQFVVSPSQKT
jgi:hypothetical protein